MESMGIKICDAYGAVMDWCKQHTHITAAPDFTYTQCALQDVGGVHFQEAGYTVLADTMYECMFNGQRPPTPPPAWETCEAAEETYCPGEAGKGRECCSCVAASGNIQPRICLEATDRGATQPTHQEDRGAT